MAACASLDPPATGEITGVALQGGNQGGSPSEMSARM